MTIDVLLVTHLNKRVGFKVFDRLENALYSPYYNILVPVPAAMWVNEEDYRPPNVIDWIDHAQFTYPTGWHFFHHLCDAIAYANLAPNSRVVRKVKIKDIVATGELAFPVDGQTVLLLVSVAKRMFIDKEVYVPEERPADS